MKNFAKSVAHLPVFFRPLRSPIKSVSRNGLKYNTGPAICFSTEMRATRINLAMCTLAFAVHAGRTAQLQTFSGFRNSVFLNESHRNSDACCMFYVQYIVQYSDHLWLKTFTEPSHSVPLRPCHHQTQAFMAPAAGTIPSAATKDTRCHTTDSPRCLNTRSEGHMGFTETTDMRDTVPASRGHFVSRATNVLATAAAGLAVLPWSSKAGVFSDDVLGFKFEVKKTSGFLANVPVFDDYNKEEVLIMCWRASVYHLDEVY